MKYVNKNKFNKIISEWLRHDTYEHEDGVLSATSILKPIKAIQLQKKHWDDIEVDIDTLFASRLGTAIHDSFEKIQLKNFIQEQRYYAEIMGQKISGKFDFMEKLKDDKYKLSDLKTTSVWTFVYGSNIDVTTKQLSIYRWLGHQNGLDILDKANIIYIFTDWSKIKAKQSATYPKFRSAIKPIQLLSLADTEALIKERITAINSDTMPDCSDDELWKSDDKIKVYKDKNKNASKVCDTKDQARAYIHFASEANLRKGKSPKYRIEVVKGKVNRCNYCDVSEFCDQYKQLKENDLIRD